MLTGSTDKRVTDNAKNIREQTSEVTSSSLSIQHISRFSLFHLLATMDAQSAAELRGQVDGEREVAHADGRPCDGAHVARPVSCSGGGQFTLLDVTPTPLTTGKSRTTLSGNTLPPTRWLQHQWQ